LITHQKTEIKRITAANSGLLQAGVEVSKKMNNK
jgi:hypothetical protein